MTQENTALLEAQDTRLWCLHHIGPDEVHPAPDFATAQKWADWANAKFAEYADISRFVVAVWPWAADRHALWLQKAIDEWTAPDSPTQSSGEAEDGPSLAFAKARAWQHFGIAWENLEQVSRNELYKQAVTWFTSPATPTTDSLTADAAAVREADIETMATAFAKVFYGPSFDPFQNPEAYDLVEQGMRAALGGPEKSRATECPSSPNGRHQVDTSMESGPNNCFHCERPMGTRT